MVLNKEEIAKFQEAVKPLIKFLNDNPQTYHPHVKIIIDNGSAELVEGSVYFPTDEFICD